ncbi:hypothetical protein [Lunatimonas salinarum]|uniref:hypothetical protein n=1 Tax=Lunatimonas salinarum TaxID=1774590 RepID=UPI001AE03E39|nr:hypothetical protein [Lunatimonas salinarum]
MIPLDHFREEPGCRVGKALLQDLPGIGSKRTEYVYDLVSGNVNQVHYQSGYPDQLIHRYRYDADNRLEEVHTSTDGLVWNRDASYYYYPHGPLARVELGEYNVQGDEPLRKCPVGIFRLGPGCRVGSRGRNCFGWLKGVNLPYAGDPGDDGLGTFRTGGDAFAFALGYYEGDYKPINPNVSVSDGRDNLWDAYKDIRGTTAAQGLYNGNISWMSTNLPGLGGNRMQGMVYGYDQLHRIVQARSLSEYGPAGYAARTSGAKKYDADYTYDPNEDRA